MFAGRLVFLPDSEIPFGRLQPYLAVGRPSFSAVRMPASRILTATGRSLAFPTRPVRWISVWRPEAAIKYKALKNVSVDVFFKYCYANPTYHYRYFTLQPSYNLLGGGIGVAYHF
jgi:hypothetical protein